jgi:ribosomal protein S17
MSLGYVGCARLAVEDDEYAIYEYSGENWNDGKSVNGDAMLFDGEIQIKKSSLEEPDIHEKIHKMPNHKKNLVRKRITHVVDIQQKIDQGEIVIIRECKNEFRHYSTGKRYLATRLLHQIFDEYQETGKLPQKTEFMQ